ncbi:LuxR family two component transcriptional regulator [Pseudomonas sp. SJZ079]|uniref:response regulator transcription factor n=1 Tax=Pseudomonas sp. SJZ079 TaxID=2572887 RepID=UPI001199BCC0|nr:response regulator [Pseudomonas sp. SJZ079]TWC43075.1 LuxR family two component transcriptional regulator [Pseudomonas sp. SJZ079]
MINQQSPVVYLLDDDPDVREGLALLLRSVGLSSEAYASSAEFIGGYAAHAIGCLILDIRMPGESGLQLLDRLSAEHIDLPVIILTGHGDLAACRRAFRSGAVEFLSKPADEGELIEAVQGAVRAHIRSREKASVSRQAQARLARLTEREGEVLAKIVDGLSNKQIARELALSPRTVESHRANLFEKLDVDSLAQLVRLYLTALAPE